MILFNYIYENSNDIMFYSLFSTTVGFMGYSLIKTYINSYSVDEGVQTDAWEDFSERASQLVSDNITSIETVTPRFSPVEYIDTGIQSISSDVSTIPTVLPEPPVDILIATNQDIEIDVINYVDDIILLSDIGSNVQIIADMLSLGFM